MAIQNRRGAYADFTPTKMVPGEFAVVLQNDPNANDGKAVYIAFAAGSAKRLATYEDMLDQIGDACEAAVEESTEEAESWATGKRNGVDVPDTDPAYHNNSKYYSQESYKNAEAWADGQRGGVDVPDSDPAYHNNSKYYKEQASVSESNASSSASEAASHKNDAATSAATATTKATEASASADRAEAAAETAVAASGTRVYSIAASPDTNGMALYYINDD